jgi:hypothetical protein
MHPACTGTYIFAPQVGTVSAAVAVWLVAVTVYFFTSPNNPRHKWARLVGRVALTAALALYPAATTGAISLVHCTTTTLSVRSLSTLDGGPTMSNLANPSATASVTVLASDPYVMCWSPRGSQQPAGIVAVVTIAIYVILLPVGCLVGLLRDKALRFSLHGVPRRCAVLFIRDLLPLSSAVGGSASEPLPDPLLAPFLSDYRPEAWFTKHADLLLTLTLAILKALLPYPSTLSQVLLKACIVTLIALGLASHSLFARPFLPADAWKGWVRALILVITAGSAISNACSSLTKLGHAGESVTEGVSILSYVLLGLVGITAVVLVVGFCHSVWVSAAIEQRSMEERHISVKDATTNPLYIEKGARRKLMPHFDEASVEPAFDCTNGGDVVTVDVQQDERVQWRVDNSISRRTSTRHVSMPLRTREVTSTTGTISQVGSELVASEMFAYVSPLRMPHVHFKSATGGSAVRGPESTEQFHFLSPVLVRSVKQKSSRRLKQSPWSVAALHAATSANGDLAAGHVAALQVRDALRASESSSFSDRDAGSLAIQLCDLLKGRAQHDPAVAEAVCEALVALRRRVGNTCVMQTLTSDDGFALRTLIRNICDDDNHVSSRTLALKSAAGSLLSEVAEESEAFARAAINEGAIQALASAASADSINADAPLNALVALTAHKAGSVVLTNGGGMETLACLMASREPLSCTVLAAAANLVANAAAHENSAAGRFLAAGGAKALVGLFRRCTTAANECGNEANAALLASAVAGAICSIAATSLAESANELLNAGALCSLATVLRLFAHDAAVSEVMCWALLLLLKVLVRLPIRSRAGADTPLPICDGTSVLATTRVLESAGVNAAAVMADVEAVLAAHAERAGHASPVITQARALQQLLLRGTD